MSVTQLHMQTKDMKQETKYCLKGGKSVIFLYTGCLEIIIVVMCDSHTVDSKTSVVAFANYI